MATRRIKLQFDYDEAGEGRGKGGKATIYVNGKQVAAGRIERTQPALYSADETADVGLDEATQVADKVFKDVEDSKFTGYVTEVRLASPPGSRCERKATPDPPRRATPAGGGSAREH